jgi:uncharacterized protein (DUF2235 family)
MTRRLAVCCDGTWNKPDQMKSAPAEANRTIPAPTNVAKLALGVAPEDGRQLVLYDRGVGTRPFEHLIGGAFGYGLSRNIRECYRWLVETYEEGDELYIFGFSRGAYTARSLAGFIRNCGILRRQHVDQLPQAFALYRDGSDRTHPDGIEATLFRSTYSHPDHDIQCIGVWDTVGSLGIPFRIIGWRKLWGFHDVTLSSHVRNAFHALAIDERRRAFKPTFWDQQAAAVGKQRLEQVWFSGVHSGVGGGYADPALAEISLLWMVDRAREAGLVFDLAHFRVGDPPVDLEDRWLGKVLGPNADGELRESYKGMYRLMPPYVRTTQLPALLPSATRTDESVGDAGTPTVAPGQSVASSAQRRHQDDSKYRPAGLDPYIELKGPFTPVTEQPA